MSFLKIKSALFHSTSKISEKLNKIKTLPVAASRVKGQKSSVWVEFGALTAKYNPINLGQGFPDTPPPKIITDSLKTIAEDPNLWASHQYIRGFGHPQLVLILSKIYSHFYNVKINPNEEVLVTVGAYLALYYAINGWVEKKDEVIIFEPAYDSYCSQVALAGGTPVQCPMSAPADATSSSQFSINFDELERKITKKTKMMVLNNPHNPTGKLFRRDELEKLAEIANKYNLIVIADEVYEFHVWNSKDMIRFASLPGMYKRTISIGSAGKAFSVTGWKIGWAIGPKHLLTPMKHIHQNCVFTCSTPTQKAVAEAFENDWPKFLNNPENSYLATGLSSELKKQRDKLIEILKSTRMKVIVPDSGYFMLANYAEVRRNIDLKNSDEPDDFIFSKWLCKEMNIGVIPMTAFYYQKENKLKNDRFIRFCFFKKDETLNEAAKILKQL